MIYLTTDEVIQLHDMLIQQSGGRPGVLNRGYVDSAVAQPQAAFGGHELNPTLHEKASALAFSLARNHGFHDGNKRIAHAAMETFIVLNGFQIDADVDVQEDLFLRPAAGSVTSDELSEWIRLDLVPIPTVRP